MPAPIQVDGDKSSLPASEHTLNVPLDSSASWWVFEDASARYIGSPEEVLESFLFTAMGSGEVNFLAAGPVLGVFWEDGLWNKSDNAEES